MEDEIVEAVRRVREAYAARFNYDIAAMVRDAQERQSQSGHEVVTPPSLRPEHFYIEKEQPKAA